jgi:hypothetical protein
MVVRFAFITRPGAQPASWLASSAFRTTFVERPSGTSSALASRGRRPWPWVGHKTESIYRRYSIVDQAMLEVGARKLDQLQQAQGLGKAVVVSIRPTKQPAN